MSDTPTDFASDLPVLERIETLIVLCSDKYYEAGRRREIGLGGHDDAIVEGDAKRREAILLIERELTASTAKVSALQDRVKELEETLQYVERWANHHGQKSCMTPAEALSCIQHYPPILAITRGYADGKVPDTPNPWERVKVLEADAARWRRLQTERYGGTLLLNDGLRLNGDEPESEWDAALSTKENANG